MICPRRCGADRTGGKTGRCGVGGDAVVARAALHFWEEPCLTSAGGASGAVFFSGCNLGCVYCQNSAVSRGKIGKTVSVERLREIFDELVDLGADNIDLVTPTHFLPVIARALEKKPPVPVIYNCGGYESVDSLKTLEGKIDIYLPDMKYSLPGPAFRYSRAKDYPSVAKDAISEMFRQTGRYVIDADGVLQKGLMVRHLQLPGNLRNTLGVISWFAETFEPGDALFSLMGQYTPMPDAAVFPELRSPLSDEEYETAQRLLFSLGIEDGYVQESGSSGECYIPDFDLTGV